MPSKHLIFFEGGACVRRRGRLCNGTMTQWPVQHCLALPRVNPNGKHSFSPEVRTSVYADAAVWQPIKAWSLAM